MQVRNKLLRKVISTRVIVENNITEKYSLTRCKEMCQESTIMFVCWGNICRSPFAEAYLDKNLNNSGKQFDIYSAGVGVADETTPPKTAVEVGKEFGVDIECKQSKMVTERLVNDADIILVMDYVILSELVRKYPSSERNSYLLASYQPTNQTISDPHNLGPDVFRKSYRKISNSIGKLTGQLANG